MEDAMAPICQVCGGFKYKCERFGHIGEVLPVQAPTPDLMVAFSVRQKMRKKNAARWYADVEAVLELHAEAEDDLTATLAALELDRAIIANVNNTLFGSQGYFIFPSCVEAIDKLKEHSNQTVRRADKAEAEVARLQQALEVCAVPLEALRLVRERHSLPELSPEIQAAIMQATEVIRAVLADQE